MAHRLVHVAAQASSEASHKSYRDNEVLKAIVKKEDIATQVAMCSS